jgi:hypothetical protein
MVVRYRSTRPRDRWRLWRLRGDDTVPSYCAPWCDGRNVISAHQLTGERAQTLLASETLRQEQVRQG